MLTYRIILTPVSSIDEFPASDRLFGALCWGIRAIYGEERLCSILDRFDSGDPSFVLSSSFPVLETSGEKVYFYPVPNMPGPGMSNLKEIAGRYNSDGLAFKTALTQTVADWKRFKKARFVTQSVLEKILINGTLVNTFESYHIGKTQSNNNAWSTLQLGGTVKLVFGDLIVDENEYMRVFGDSKPARLQTTVITQKNSIDRLLNSTGSAGELHYSRDIYFRSDPHVPKLALHFLIKTPDINFLRPVFSWLADTGIGGNRSSGSNHFSLSEPEQVDTPGTDGNFFLTLSRYMPNESEEPLLYNLLPQRHRLESSHFRNRDVWKKKVIYFREGSCFKCNERKEYYGRIEEVKRVDDHRIRQNGLAFPIFGSAYNESGD